jgi:hypothetical protein
MDTNNTSNGPLKAVEYMARVLPGGQLELPAPVRHELQLRPNMQVKVIILRKEDTPEEKGHLAAERAEVFRGIDKLREQLSGKEGNLTEALLQAREEEDASL